MADDKCKCPRCNCFAGLVHVPVKGEFLVRDGKVLKVLESEMTDYVEDDIGYQVWVSREDNDDDV